MRSRQAAIASPMCNRCLHQSEHPVSGPRRRCCPSHGEVTAATMASPFRATSPGRSICAPTALRSPPSRTPKKLMPPRTSAPRNRIAPRTSNPPASRTMPAGETMDRRRSRCYHQCVPRRDGFSRDSRAAEGQTPTRFETISLQSGHGPSRKRLSITAERRIGEASKWQSLRPISRGIRQPSRSRYRKHMPR